MTHMMRYFLVIGFILSVRMSIQAQTIDEIRADRSYFWGEANGNTLKEAEDAALSMLVNQIWVNVESSFTMLKSEIGKGGKTSVEEAANSLIKTYSTASLQNVERMVLGDEPDAKIFCYIKRTELDKAFAARKNKILEFIEYAVASEERAQIADALRYYYWAQMLLRTHPDGAQLTVTDKAGKVQLLATWIPLSINRILANVSIAMREELGEENLLTVELLITYLGTPVLNFDYCFWNGRSWSSIVSAKDGRGVVELPGGSDTKSLRLKAEYQFSGESKADIELYDAMNSFPAIPYRSAYINVAKESAAPSLVVPQTAQTQTMQAQTQQTPATQVQQAISDISPVSDTRAYLPILEKVEQAISSQNYDAIRSLFTPAGFDVYCKLIKYGQARMLKQRTPYQFINFEGGVICRSIPMSFKFKSNDRQFIEDVVLVFDKNRKITTLQFGLSQQALADILGKKAWSERVRLVLINFLETYKTAYALKRLDYIDKIFAEDALIISGTELKTVTTSERNPYINNAAVKQTRYDKATYLKRLESNFAKNEYINLKFADNKILKSGKGNEIYGIQIKQDYFSTLYGDTGYLFLLVDLSKPDEPVISVRTWQKEKDPDFGVIGLGQF